MTLGSPAPLGSRSPFGSGKIKDKLMMTVYASGRIHYGDESPLAVVYKRRSTAIDGSAADAQYYNHATGAWDNALDPATHSRAMDRDPDDPWQQSMPLPLAVADDPTAYAVIHPVGPDGSLGRPVDIQASSQLGGLARRWGSRP